MCFRVAQSVHWHTYILPILYKYCSRMDTEAKWKIIVLLSFCTLHLALERGSQRFQQHPWVQLRCLILREPAPVPSQPVMVTCQTEQLVWPPALDMAGVRLAHSQLMARHSHQHMARISRLSPAGLLASLWGLGSSLVVISGFDLSWILCHLTSPFLGLGWPLCYWAKLLLALILCSD